MLLHFIKKISNISYMQYTLFYFLIVVLIQIPTANANQNIKTIKLSTLGGFKANFSEVKTVRSIKAQSLIGEISYMPGENYSVTFPFDVQRANYLVKNGSFVSQGDTIAIVEGYDVHHFIDEYESAKVLLEIQKKHFQTNKQYFENRSIKRSQWIEITKSYYAAKLNFEHFQHLMSFVHIDENEQVSLVSPIAGIIQIPSLVSSKKANDLAFDIINSKAIKVKITMPLLLTNNLSYFQVSPSCQLTINSIEKITNKFHQVLWAEPASTSCELTLGQIIKVQPVQKIQGYKISKSAIFEFENKNHVAIKLKESLSLIPIKLIGTSEEDYIFTTTENIGGQQGLVSSVSILQGNLLSLGAE